MERERKPGHFYIRRTEPEQRLYIRNVRAKPSRFYIKQLSGEKPTRFYIKNSATKENAPQRPTRFYIRHGQGEKPLKFYIKELPEQVVFSLQAKKKKDEDKQPA